jgi:hypothetical protein
MERPHYQNQAASTYCIAGDIASHNHVVNCTVTLDKTDVNVGPSATLSIYNTDQVTEYYPLH